MKKGVDYYRPASYFIRLCVTWVQGSVFIGVEAYLTLMDVWSGVIFTVNKRHAFSLLDRNFAASLQRTPA